MPYLEDSFKITSVKVDHNYPPGQGIGPDGYTKRSGAPTSYMVRLDGSKRWRRVMIWQFSNAGTCFVRVDGVEYIVRYDGTLQE